MVISKVPRPMVASVYVADGADMVLNTQAHVEGAEAVLRHVRSIVSRSTYQKLPQDPELLVRVVGGLKVGAGSLLGLGRCPRLSAGVLALLSVPTIVARHAFWETQDVEEKVARRQGFLTSVALLGGLVITSMDTGGKPGLGWRVRQALPSRAESESMVSQAADWLGDASGRVVQYVGDNREDWLQAAQANSRVAGKRVVRAAVAAQEQAQAAYADAQVLSGRAARRAVRQADRLQVRAVRALRRAQERLDGKV